MYHEKVVMGRKKLAFQGKEWPVSRDVSEEFLRKPRPELEPILRRSRRLKKPLRRSLVREMNYTLTEPVVEK